MSRRRVRPALPRALGGVLSQLSVFVVIAFSLAVGTVSGVHIAHHYGYIGGRLTVVSAASNQGATGLDPGTQQEAGLPDAVSGQGSGSAGINSIPSDAPMADILKRGTLKGGLWLPIVMYHYVRVAPAGDRMGFALSVTPTDFAAQMAWLKENGYTTVTMRDVDQILMGQKPAPAKPVALTFDDGYMDFYTAAAPTLRANGQTATNYVPTQLVGDRGGAYMTWPQIQELDHQGFEMAAHSQFHVDVSKVNAQRAKTEIFGARADLEQHLGHQVIDWAYPYGGFNYATIKLVADAGYISATTTIGGAFHDTGQLPLLTRVRVNGGESLQQFEVGIKQ
ncbi:MAG: polysaccharide deacetylase family protein [Candidatus Dormiibacterota bacterium]